MGWLSTSMDHVRTNWLILACFEINMEAGHGGSLSIQEKQSAQGQTLSQRDPMSKKRGGVGGQGEVAWEEKEINI